MASAASGLIASPSPAASTITAPRTDATSRVARPRMAGATPSDPALAGESSANFDFQKNLEAAEIEFLKRNYGSAHQMFDAIRSKLKRAQLPKTSFFPARCFLGLALSLDPNKDMTAYALEAQKALDTVYAHRNDWLQSEISSGHAELRRNLQVLRKLLPDNDAINAKISECASHVVPLDSFKEMVKHGHKFFKAENAETARQYYEKALLLIKNEEEIDFKIARIPCLLNLTGTYKKNEPERIQRRDETQAAIFELHERVMELYDKGKYSRVNAYRLLIRLLRDLRCLTPATDANYTAIQSRINGCRLEIPEEAPQIQQAAQIPAAAEPASSTAPEHPHKKVTKSPPDGSWRLEKLFMAALCIAGFAVVSFALYRRHLNVNFSK